MPHDVSHGIGSVGWEELERRVFSSSRIGIAQILAWLIESWAAKPCNDRI